MIPSYRTKHIVASVLVWRLFPLDPLPCPLNSLPFAAAGRRRASPCLSPWNRRNPRRAFGRAHHARCRTAASGLPSSSNIGDASRMKLRGFVDSSTLGTPCRSRQRRLREVFVGGLPEQRTRLREFSTDRRWFGGCGAGPRGYPRVESVRIAPAYASPWASHDRFSWPQVERPCIARKGQRELTAPPARTPSLAESAGAKSIFAPGWPRPGLDFCFCIEYQCGSLFHRQREAGPPGPFEDRTLIAIHPSIQRSAAGTEVLRGERKKSSTMRTSPNKLPDRPRFARVPVPEPSFCITTWHIGNFVEVKAAEVGRPHACPNPFLEFSGRLPLVGRGRPQLIRRPSKITCKYDGQKTSGRTPSSRMAALSSVRQPMLVGAARSRVASGGNHSSARDRPLARMLRTCVAHADACPKAKITVRPVIWKRRINSDEEWRGSRNQCGASSRRNLDARP